MDLETQNLYHIKKLNRTIVEKAFNESTTNKNYVFPKKYNALQTDSDTFQIISLQSRVSQKYNLHQQNVIQHHQKQNLRSIIPISDLLKQKMNKKTVHKTKKYQNKKIMIPYQKNLSQQKYQKSKYLSLSSKQTEQIRNKSQKSFGIKITQLFNQKELQKINLQNKSKQFIKKQIENFTQNFFQGVRNLSQRCFSADNKKSQKSQENELIFHNQKMIFSKQRFFDPRKKLVSERTADTTPKFFQKDQSDNTKVRKGFIRFHHHQNISISPFNFI